MSVRRIFVLVASAAAIAIACITQLSCGDTSHIFQGRFFVQDRACLGTTSSLDVVSGDALEQTCAPTCLAQPFADGGHALYVATMCPPYPFAFDASASDPLCPSALDAFGRNDTCFSDGGSSHPLPLPPPPIDDAGAD